jgi:hypothetical protein
MTYRGKKYVNGEYLRSIFATVITKKKEKENQTYRAAYITRYI